MTVTGILLAGGSSRRFPPNKLLVDYEGEPLFWRPLRALASVCDPVLVIARADGEVLTLPGLARPPRLLRDPVADQGPLVATRFGLESASSDWALLAGGDMTDLAPNLLHALVERGGSGTVDAIALTDAERPWPMPALLRVAPARAAAVKLVDSGERRLRALLEVLRVDRLDSSWWSAYDPRGMWRRDIDRPTDLR